jgi:hypothetical protein
LCKPERLPGLDASLIGFRLAGIAFEGGSHFFTDRVYPLNRERRAQCIGWHQRLQEKQSARQRLERSAIDAPLSVGRRSLPRTVTHSVNILAEGLSSILDLNSRIVP